MNDEDSTVMVEGEATQSKEVVADRRGITCSRCMGSIQEGSIYYCDPNKSQPILCQSCATEDPITREQDRLVQLIKGAGEYLGAAFAEIQDVSERLSQPHLLRDSAPVRFFSLFSQLRDAVKQVDAAIGAEIDTESMAEGREHDVGRLQGMVQRYFERIRAKSAPAEGKLVTFTRKLWAAATDVAALKKNKVTNVFVKEAVNGQTLTSWVNELDKDKQDMPMLPDDIKSAIKLTEKFFVSARKA